MLDYSNAFSFYLRFYLLRSIDGLLYNAFFIYALLVILDALLQTEEIDCLPSVLARHLKRSVCVDATRDAVRCEEDLVEH